MKNKGLIFLILIFALGVVLAQQRRGGFGGRGFGGGRGQYGAEGGWISEDARTAREVPQHGRNEDGSIYETPIWTNAPGFEKDVFTFVRVRRERNPSSSGGSWSTDAPDSDLNFSFRLQQMTSIKVDPDGRFIHLTDPDLCNYPFIYMVEPGSLYLNDVEVVALRKYLLNGGFLMLDDFWGEREWQGMATEIKKVFPDKEFVELPLTHPIYNCVFPINAKGQVPSIGFWESRGGETSERGADSREVHHRAIFDDKGRMMIIATHNTDNGDGWEREGENRAFFENFSEKISYPLGINIIFYSMTH
jgi:Domain of unknown function (DUF4159)